MKIGWATPFNLQSAIGRLSVDLVRQLQIAGQEVTIIRTEIGNALAEPPITTDYPVIRWDGPWTSDDFDLIALNIGDNYPFHGGILERPLRVPAAGLIHDWCLVGLFMAWAENLPDKGASIVKRLYGEQAWKTYCSTPSERFLESAVRHFPMTEWAVETLDGAIIFSSFYRERVAASCPGPVACVAAPIRPRTHILPPNPTDKINLLTFGLINPNKRVESILRALGAMPELKDRIFYRITGQITSHEQKRLTEIARKVGVRNVQFDGRVSDGALDHRISEADIICCLRYPAPEGCSASALEAMLSARPIIVTDVGFYSTLPDQVALKVDPENELPALQRHLRFLVNSPQVRIRMGQCAAEWVATTHNAARCAQDLITHFEKVIEAQPLLHLAETLGRHAGQWGIGIGDPFFERLESTIEGLWGENPA